jgi:Fur family transcriptional regulator, peroxide stress response regulator
MSALPIDFVVQALKDKGLRVTPQRCAVYSNLLGRDDHPTAEQLLRDLNQSFPISSQATVYSSLQSLRQSGLVREVLLEEGVSRYDANIDPHHHFRCRCCGTIKDIAWAELPPLSLAGLRPDFKAETYEVTVYGVCTRCETH